MPSHGQLFNIYKPLTIYQETAYYLPSDYMKQLTNLFKYMQ